MGITKTRYSRPKNECNSRYTNLKRRIRKDWSNLKSWGKAPWIPQNQRVATWPWHLIDGLNQKGKRRRGSLRSKVPGIEMNWREAKRRNQTCRKAKTWAETTRGGRKKTIARTAKTMRRRARTPNLDRMRVVVAMNPKAKIQSCWWAVSPCLKQPLRLLPASLKTVWGVLELKVMRSQEDWQCGCPECTWTTSSADSCTSMKQFSVRRKSKCGYSSSN